MTMVDENGSAIYKRALDVYGGDWYRIVKDKTVLVPFSDHYNEYYHISDSCKLMTENVSTAVRMTVGEALRLGYGPCIFCVGELRYVSISPEGAYYHRADCALALREKNLETVKLNKALKMGYRPCLECSAGDYEPLTPRVENPSKEAIFWHAQNGRYYHADRTCSGMSAAMPISAFDAQAQGLPPCPICMEEYFRAQEAGAAIAGDIERNDAPTPTSVAATDLAGCTPYSLFVRAHDPNGQIDEIMNYNAVPETENAGVINQSTPNLEAAARIFNHLTLTPYEGDEQPFANHWHFGIEYTVMDEKKNTRTVRLDFYDYSNLVGYTRLYLPGDAGKTKFVTMPLEDSLALEDIYLDVVARLKRLPTETEE